MIVTKAPGKLYIAGEYAVIEPGHPAVLVAVDKFIKVSLKEALDKGSITSSHGMPVMWTRENEQPVLEREEGLSHIISAIKIVEAYAKELGKASRLFNLKVSSELENEKGIKYGLGSSAAVTVATIKALCEYYEIVISDKELFKLASLAHLKLNSTGSCGDIAASVYGGWIAFTTFDRNWVLEKIRHMSISQLINIKWPSLYIEGLEPPKELKLVVGWTGSPASTEKLVADVNEKLGSNSRSYEIFLDNSKRCVRRMIAALKEKDIEEIQIQIEINRKLLLNMSNDLNIMIETPLLSKFIEIAGKYNGYGKSSGAGGGDCGIVIFKEVDDIRNFIEELREEGISYLPLEVYK